MISKVIILHVQERKYQAKCRMGNYEKRLNITYTAANSYRSLHSKLTSKGSKIQADKSLSEQATSHICITKGGR